MATERDSMLGPNKSRLVVDKKNPNPPLSNKSLHVMDHKKPNSPSTKVLRVRLDTVGFAEN